MDKNEKYIQILLALALILDVYIGAHDFDRDKETDHIEENLAYALDQNIVATRNFEKMEFEAIELVDAHLSYVHESLKGDDATSERAKKILEDKIMEFKNNSNNISCKYKNSISNATKLKEDIMESINNREEIRESRPLLDFIAIILLFGALFLTFKHKDDVKNSLLEIKSENRDIKKSLKGLDDQIKEHNEELWNNQGHILFGQGRYEEAMHAYDKALEINPNNAYAWMGRGKVLESLGHTEDANLAFARAKELSLKGGSGS
jgi:tetratricopeptide (TPR) repeat protein